VSTQRHRVFDYLEEALHDAGLTMGDVIKCNVYLTDKANFPAMNVAHGARFAVAVSRADDGGRAGAAAGCAGGNRTRGAPGG